MTIYFCLYILIAFCMLLEQFFSKGKKIAFFLISLSIVCIVGLRNENMGSDIPGYLRSFKFLSELSLVQAWNLPPFLNYEKGYVLFNSLLGKISTDVHFFLFACAFISFIPVVFFAYKNTTKFSSSMTIYLFLPPFLLLYSGLRQCLAIGLCMLSFEFVKKRKIVPFVLLVALATSFHTSAYLFFITYPLYVVRLDKDKRWATVFALLGVYMVKTTLFLIFAKLLRDNPHIDNNGAFTLNLFFISIYIFSFMLSKKTKKEEGLINIFYVACFCQVFSSLNSNAIRAGYYFMLFLIPLLPIVIENFENENAKVITKIIFFVGFVCGGLFFISTGSWAQANPHSWFWQ